MEIVIIAAVAANGVIGADGDIPWHYPADLARFKRITTGHPVIMGRRTYENIVDRLGHPLPDRTSIVLTTTRTDAPAGVVFVDSVAKALAEARERDTTAYVIGGAAVYEAFLPRADRLVLTEIHEAVPGDTRFPEWDPAAWRETSREPRDEFDFVEYTRSPTPDP